GQYIGQGARVAEVMQADALQGQIHPIPDARMEPSRPVERLLAVNLVAGEDHHPANRVTDRLKRLDLRSWERRQYRLHREISLEGGDDRVTGQPVLTQRRTVVQVP